MIGLRWFRIGDVLVEFSDAWLIQQNNGVILAGYTDEPKEIVGGMGAAEAANKLRQIALSLGAYDYTQVPPLPPMLMSTWVLFATSNAQLSLINLANLSRFWKEPDGALWKVMCNYAALDTAMTEPSAMNFLTMLTGCTVATIV